MDVYSYGILLLEMLSRRKPTNEMFSGELTLRRWILESFPDSVLQILDNGLLNTNDEEARAVLLTVELALECTSDLPEERPNMREVASRIANIRLNHLQMPIPSADLERAGN